MKVLLMGNGCSATEHKLGKLIDSEFDLVLRMNRFKTEGYEDYVGSKTDVWVVSDNAFQWVLNQTDGVEGSNNWRNYQAIYVGIPTFKYQESKVDWSDKLGKPVYIFPPQVADSATSKLNLPSDQWPTLGMQCLYGLLMDEEVKDIYVYGFDGKNKKYKYLHYFDNEKNPEWETSAYYGRKITHDDNREFNHIQDLIKENKIKRLEDYNNEE